VFIHPFVDGNGRVARLLMNLALLRGEYTIALIPAVRRMEYVSALEAAHIDDKVFVNFIADCVVATQADLLRLLRNNLKQKKGAVRHRETGENLSERILSEIRANPGINTPALASMLNLSLRTTQRHLQALSESGKIEFRGARKNGGYYLDG
jgi:Fic family protein